MDLELEGKSALITGGSKGIGLATAQAFAAEGVSLHLAARSTGDLESARDNIGRKFGVPVSIHAVDLTQGYTARELAESCSDVDILVNNAGGSSQLKPFTEMNKADWDLDINVNLYGQMNVAQAVLPHMISQGYGRIINFTGGRGIPNISIYGAAKAGIIAFTEALAREVAPLGVIVNGIGPGLGETGLVKKAPAPFLEENRQRSALKRLCTPDDVAPAVAFLASDRCSYMVGQFIYLSTF